MTFDQELRDKVARMRALGVVELETANGFVRRLTLGPVPEGVVEPEPVPTAAEAAPPPVIPEAQAKADEAAKKAKAERLKFGAGK